MSMRPQIPVRSSESEQALQFIRQMGIENVSLMLGPDELTAEAIRAQKNKLAAFGLRISDAACMELQKNKSIHLGLPDRDHEIDRFNQMLRVFGEEEIPFTSIAWQPNGILRTAWKVGEYTRGGVAMYCDHFVYPEYKLGNIAQTPLDEIYRTAKRREFGLNKRNTLPTECLRCKFYFACRGECPKHRFDRGADGSPKNSLCEGLKIYFRHVEPYMEYMRDLLSKQQAPAWVMPFARKRMGLE